eukprot:SAG11_NODE_785_length_7173_cov_4.452926_2_plen_117_part_00
MVSTLTGVGTFSQLSGIGRPLSGIAFRNVSLTIAVLGNTTCRKGYPGAPAGCVDYRPLNCQAGGSATYCPALARAGGVLLPTPTAAIRLEGAGWASRSEPSGPVFGSVCMCPPTAP